MQPSAPVLARPSGRSDDTSACPRLTADRWSSALALAGAGLLPWALSLAWTLPHTTRVARWNLAWVGLDLLEAASLLTAALLRRRRDPREALALVVATTAISLDAWFDVLTAATPADTRSSLLMLPVELAAATTTAALATRSWRHSLRRHACQTTSAEPRAEQERRET